MQVIMYYSNCLFYLLTGCMQHMLNVNITTNVLNASLTYLVCITPQTQDEGSEDDEDMPLVRVAAARSRPQGGETQGPRKVPRTNVQHEPEDIDAIERPVGEEENVVDVKDAIQHELDVYCSMDGTKLSPKIRIETDLLLFWQFHSSTLPYLSRVARWALSVQSSAAESERQFS